MAGMETKLTFDLKEFKEFTHKAPGIMDGLVKESMTRCGMKMRKEAHKTIDRRTWADLQETDKYRSRYSRPLQMLKHMIRYRVTGGHKRVTTTVGIFPGRAGKRSVLNNQQFKSRYGVTVNRFGKLMTYGGRLKVRPQDRKRMRRQGFHISNRTNYIQFPKRNWYQRTRWFNPGVIVPYFEKDLNQRVERKLK